ncbi:hypothetical protein BH09ACT12_BH09ACT12_04200 [soil metagenome]
MTSSYDDLATPAEMLDDCRAADTHLRLEQAARRVTRPAPSLHFDEQPGEQPKASIEISAATARLAAALHFALE